ncbi:probable alpha-galactosidase [Corticium candelabrum]|uniref:probable alpha-galactosidase n=1 Tax=Corticium candelabrum TaxID=121492 RepID=UPI002E333A48|nr:probable alpha-galactosidase [Corticium candelabrum]
MGGAISFVLVCHLFLHTTLALDNGLGTTPAMGYNSWYDFGCSGSLNETNVMATADSLVNSGLSRLGYVYINLDDCWASGRYSNGTVYPDSKRFPSGMKALADYIHSKGLKFGVYTDRGTATCGGRPGSQDHEEIDAKTYAYWGVDYVKEDSCHASGDRESAFTQYAKMRDSLNATGRPIYYSLCGWNRWYAPIGYSLANSWRIGPDDSNWGAILKNIDINANLANYAGPGGWNDPCLLLGATYTGSLRITEMQQRTQFNMWAVMASPLLLSSNVRKISSFAVETYSNKDVIAVNQDPIGRQGIRLAGTDLSSQTLPPAHVAPCNSSSTSQLWVWDTDLIGMVFTGNEEKCLNVNNCGTDVIYYHCVKSGGTCCGASCYKNELWTLTNSGQLISQLTNSCATVNSDNTISLQKCQPDQPSQKWSYSNETETFVTPNKMCLDGNPEISSGGTNVWGRELADGSWALVFLNAGTSAANITCDATCFTSTGFDSSTKLSVTDLWMHTENGTTTGGGFTAMNVPADGGSVMIKLTRL